MKIIFRDSNYGPDSDSESDNFTVDYNIPIIPRIGEMIAFHKSILPEWLLEYIMIDRAHKIMFYAEVQSICHVYTKESVTIEIEIGFK